MSLLDSRQFTSNPNRVSLVWDTMLDDIWYDFLTLQTTRNEWLNPQGVLVISSGLAGPKNPVLIASGDVMFLIAKHQKEARLRNMAGQGLWVTWAEVQSEFMNGVCNFLSQTLRPMIATRHSRDVPIPTNLPPTPSLSEYRIGSLLGDALHKYSRN